MSDIRYTREHDYYELFGLAPTATPEEIARAHKRLAKECHPDLHPDKAWATERFKVINHAYAVLRDPAAKGEYDRLRWAEIGGGRAAAPRPAAGPVRQPRKRGARVDPERHHRDRLMSYFIMGIEVVVMTLFLLLCIYAAIRKIRMYG